MSGAGRETDLISVQDQAKISEIFASSAAHATSESS